MKAWNRTASAASIAAEGIVRCDVKRRALQRTLCQYFFGVSLWFERGSGVLVNTLGYST